MQDEIAEMALSKWCKMRSSRSSRKRCQENDGCGPDMPGSWACCVETSVKRRAYIEMSVESCFNLETS